LSLRPKYTRHKVIEVRPQLVMTVIMEAFDSCFFDCATRSLDLTIDPWMIGFCQAMLDPAVLANHVETHGT